MPDYRNILYGDLEQVWKSKGYRFVQKKPPDVYLSLTPQDNADNHIHIYKPAWEPNGEYNIKCNGNAGNSRQKHKIYESQSTVDLVGEMEHNWNVECSSHTQIADRNSYLKYWLNYFKHGYTVNSKDSTHAAINLVHMWLAQPTITREESTLLNKLISNQLENPNEVLQYFSNRTIGGKKGKTKKQKKMKTTKKLLRQRFISPS
jgi:hypothetical protein